jgi:superfamily II DNA or RNA helicase
MMTSYADFLARKQAQAGQFGHAVNITDVHPRLHPWQARVVQWAVLKGRAAIWADTGLGKTIQQLEWARLSAETSLVVAPLAVCAQTVREASTIDIAARYVRGGPDVGGPGVYVTNYEMISHFDPAKIGAVVLDEASILKQSTGRTRTRLIQHFADVPHRLACTATPAPNDPEELTNQAEFLGIMPRVEMLAAYFVHDDTGWRLKGHAREPMFRWMSTWAIALRRPSDIGYSDDGYVLPGLSITPEVVAVEVEADGQLFATDLGGVGGRAKVRRDTLPARCERAAELVAREPDEPWLLWCGLNDEADMLAGLIPGAVNVRGSWTPEEKAQAFLDFADGKIRYLITKTSIASFGLNWQHCARMVFVGLNDSYEAMYQAIRRCYRYGQTRVVNVHIVLSELESQIAANVARKEREADRLMGELVSAMHSGDTLGVS